jgi:hypothetical protein
MEQRLSTKILREEHHKIKKFVEELVQHFGTEALSYSEVCYWMCDFARDREKLEDTRRSGQSGQSGQSADFICHSRIQAAQEEMPNASVR